MNGIILLNKEQGITSQKALTILKRQLKLDKVGHAGTLDPLASGLLLVLVGKATKLSDYLMLETKEYIADIYIGKSTDTLDSEGNIVEEKKVINIADIDKVLNSFLGKSKQIPPMYSAIKIKGKKLYELARSGIEVEREEREIEIFEIERISDVLLIDDHASFKFRVVCSKGTYIRSLCADIGKKLGYPAHMSGLVRTKIGNFSLSNAVSLKDIEEGKINLVKMHEALSGFKIIDVDENMAKLVMNGASISLNDISDEKVVITYKNELIGIYNKVQGKYKAERVWN